MTGIGTGVTVLALAAGWLAKYPCFAAGNTLGLKCQLLAWTVGGVIIVALALAEPGRQRDATAWLLCLWVLGVLAFAPLFYWMINVRTLLPMAPAVALLVARRLELGRAAIPGGAWWALGASAVLSMLVAQADYHQAGNARIAAAAICARHASSGKVSFKGHLGFQYYMQAGGARPLDNDHRQEAGDWVAEQQFNAGEIRLAPEQLTLQEELTLPAFPGVATMQPVVGGGFYSQWWGPLPFAFGAVPPESFFVYRFTPSPAQAARPATPGADRATHD